MSKCLSPVDSIEGLARVVLTCVQVEQHVLRESESSSSPEKTWGALANHLEEVASTLKPILCSLPTLQHPRWKEVFTPLIRFLNRLMSALVTPQQQTKNLSGTIRDQLISGTLFILSQLFTATAQYDLQIIDSTPQCQDGSDLTPGHVFLNAMDQWFVTPLSLLGTECCSTRLINGPFLKCWENEKPIWEAIGVSLAVWSDELRSRTQASDGMKGCSAVLEWLIESTFQALVGWSSMTLLMSSMSTLTEWQFSSATTTLPRILIPSVDSQVVFQFATQLRAQLVYTCVLFHGNLFSTHKNRSVAANSLLTLRYLLTATSSDISFWRQALPGILSSCFAAAKDGYNRGQRVRVVSLGISLQLIAVVCEDTSSVNKYVDALVTTNDSSTAFRTFIRSTLSTSESSDIDISTVNWETFESGDSFMTWRADLLQRLGVVLNALFDSLDWTSSSPQIGVTSLLLADCIRRCSSFLGNSLVQSLWRRLASFVLLTTPTSVLSKSSASGSTHALISSILQRLNDHWVSSSPLSHQQIQQSVVKDYASKFHALSSLLDSILQETTLRNSLLDILTMSFQLKGEVSNIIRMHQESIQRALRRIWCVDLEAMRRGTVIENRSLTSFAITLPSTSGDMDKTFTPLPLREISIAYAEIPFVHLQSDAVKIAGRRLLAYLGAHGNLESQLGSPQTLQLLWKDTFLYLQKALVKSWKQSTSTTSTLTSSSSVVESVVSKYLLRFKQSLGETLGYTFALQVSACHSVRYVVKPVQDTVKPTVCMYKCELADCEAGNPPFRCSRCQNVWYCSAAHQAKDWKRHKLLCVVPKTTKPISQDSKPSPTILETLSSDPWDVLYSNEIQLLPPILRLKESESPSQKSNLLPSNAFFLSRSLYRQRYELLRFYLDLLTTITIFRYLITSSSTISSLDTISSNVSQTLHLFSPDLSSITVVILQLLGDNITLLGSLEHLTSLFPPLLYKLIEFNSDPHDSRIRASASATLQRLLTVAIASSPFSYGFTNIEKSYTWTFDIPTFLRFHFDTLTDSICNVLQAAGYGDSITNELVSSQYGKSRRTTQYTLDSSVDVFGISNILRQFFGNEGVIRWAVDHFHGLDSCHRVLRSIIRLCRVRFLLTPSLDGTNVNSQSASSTRDDFFAPHVLLRDLIRECFTHMDIAHLRSQPTTLFHMAQVLNSLTEVIPLPADSLLAICNKSPHIALQDKTPSLQPVIKKVKNLPQISLATILSPPAAAVSEASYETAASVSQLDWLVSSSFASLLSFDMEITSLVASYSPEVTQPPPESQENDEKDPGEDENLGEAIDAEAIPSETTQLLIDLVQRSIFLLTSRSLPTITTAVDTLSNAIIRLSDNRRHFLPILHQLWTSLVTRIEQLTELVVITTGTTRTWGSFGNQQMPSSFGGSSSASSKRRIVTLGGKLEFGSASNTVGDRQNAVRSLLLTAPSSTLLSQSTTERAVPVSITADESDLVLLGPLLQLLCLTVLLEPDFLSHKVSEDLLPHIIRVLTELQKRFITTEPPVTQSTGYSSATKWKISILEFLFKVMSEGMLSSVRAVFAKQLIWIVLPMATLRESEEVRNIAISLLSLLAKEEYAFVKQIRDLIQSTDDSSTTHAWRIISLDPRLDASTMIVEDKLILSASAASTFRQRLRKELPEQWLSTWTLTGEHQAVYPSVVATVSRQRFAHV